MTDTPSAAAPKPLSRRQGLKDGASIGFWPNLDALPAAVQAFAEDHAVATTLRDADFVAAAVADRASAVSLLDHHLDELADVASIWLVYPKGNRSDINRDSLWALLLEYEWRPVANISVDNEHSSIRIRPLKPGETGTHR